MITKTSRWLPFVALLAPLLLVSCRNEVVVRHAATLEEARTMAEAEAMPILLDFNAEWCSVCAAFAADAATSSAIQQAMSRAVTLDVDVESAAGSVLAERFAVEGLPTFVVLNLAEEELARWSGYAGADDFVRRLDFVTSDPVTLAERSVRFQEKPALDDALILAKHHRARQEWAEADRYWQRAREIDADGSRAYEAEIVSTRLAGFDAGAFSPEDVKRELIRLFDSDRVPAMEKASLVAFIFDRFERNEAHSLGSEFIDPALALLEGSNEEDAENLRPGLEIARALHVENDEEKALLLVQRSFSDGWRDDPIEINEIAWWSFENDVRLEDALALITRALEIVEDADRAMLLDTRAEILFKLGRTEQAVETIAEAVRLDPSNDYYQQQIVRFSSRDAPIL